ncbi:MAG: hypothetical protein QXW97_01910 [Candidatus Pacearchaeota archaeon]
MNKRGAEMTIGTIIVIILALVVLVVIIYGFTVGWSNLWQKITGFSPKSNVHTHVQACQIACTSESKYDYCKPRQVIFEDKGKPVQFRSCEDLQIQRGSSIGLEPCLSISCAGTEEAGSCENIGGKWQLDPCLTSYQLDITSRVTNNFNKGNNKFCCQTTCALLNGIWRASPCDGRTENDRTDDITDKVSDNPNNYRFCCVAK